VISHPRPGMPGRLRPAPNRAYFTKLSMATGCRCWIWGRGDGGAAPLRAAGAQEDQGERAAAMKSQDAAPKLRRTEAELQRPAGAPARGEPGAPPPLRVLSFNLLADGLAQNGDFINVRAPLRRCAQRAVHEKPSLLAGGAQRALAAASARQCLD
jgi:hypothetical protein